MAVDVLYPLGMGSKFNDLELRLSLRCLQENVNYGRLFISGVHKPEWLRNYTHVLSDCDIFNYHAKISKAVYDACKTDISDDFLLMNDDFFIIEKIKKFENFKRNYSLKEHLKIKGNAGLYTRLIENTSQYFEDHYDSHYPMLINKDNFIETFEKWEGKIMSVNGVLFRSIYGNENIKTDKVLEDLKINSDCDISQAVKGRWVFSIGDNAVKATEKYIQYGKSKHE